MSAERKSGSPGGTGQNAHLKTDTSSLSGSENSGNTQKVIATLRAQFALRGHTLQINRRADDGRTTYSVSRWGQSRCFSHVHDLRAFLNQIGGAK